MRILTRKKKNKITHIVYYIILFLITVSAGLDQGIEELRDTLILCYFPFSTEAFGAHGKGHSVHLSTWGDLDCTNEHPHAQVSHLPHMGILFGSNPARLHLASCWCFLKDAKCPLKGEKPAQDGVERLSSWNVILESGVNCRGEFQMKDQQGPGGKQMSSRTGSLTPATGK